MTNDEAKDAILAAAEKLPRPVTVDALQVVAAELLNPNQAFQFGEWLKRQGPALCARLNQ